MIDNLQTINNITGTPEYVLLPIPVYKKMAKDIHDLMDKYGTNSDYEQFRPEDFIKNPIALLRMRAKIKQTELAKRLNVSQAYISKIENDNYHPTKKLLEKVQKVI